MLKNEYRAARLAVVLGVALLSAACSTQYGPKSAQGGFMEKRMNTTTYALTFEAGQFANPFASLHELVPLWKQRAAELCESDDFFYDIETDTLTQNHTLFGTQIAYGYVYCNSKIVDTRELENDAAFAMFQNITDSALTYRDITPWWELLLASRFEDLERALAQTRAEYRRGEVGEAEFIRLMSTFGRINPAATAALDGWIGQYPQSAFAYYARAKHLYSMAWHYRGHLSWAEVTPQNRIKFKDTLQLAKADIQQAIALDPTQVLFAKFELDTVRVQGLPRSEVQAVYEQAVGRFPQSLEIRLPYLYFLEPRWGGSRHQMRQFVDDSVAQRAEFRALEAVILAADGDEKLMDNNFEAAIELYERAIDIAPFPYIHHQLGLAQEKLGLFKAAIESYGMAASLSPYYYPAYEGMTRCYLVRNQVVDALGTTVTLTALNNQNPALYELQGDLFYGMRRYPDALISYKKAAVLTEMNGKYQHKARMAEYQQDIRERDEAAEQQTREVAL
ncbi:DUF4034 domain-containing protein [Ketobacter sp.]|uniref:DUF4034 domain-containing protein n=1 Tax=Ketobacter sp. TaxID=2083498 RepID=UPI0025C1C13C|nr:DUF4034 domain-containing protein [Ketobacter sp.]